MKRTVPKNKKGKKTTPTQGSEIKRWTFTINNYTEKDEFDETPFEYLILGREVGAQGTHHLQGFGVLKGRGKRLTAMKKLMPRAHLEPAGGSNDINVAYCKKGIQTKLEWDTHGVYGPNYGKEADVYESGTCPIDGFRKGGESLRAKYQTAWHYAKNGDIENIDPALRLKHYNALRKIQQDYMKPAEHLDKTCGEWYYGPPNSGKTHKAFIENPEAYDKPCNKWWDGYQGQEVVVIDDFDLNHKCLGHHLKRWADRFSFACEQKGTTLQVRPKKIIVTSNYTIEQIFAGDEVLIAALKRRFQVTHFLEREYWNTVKKIETNDFFGDDDDSFSELLSSTILRNSEDTSQDLPEDASSEEFDNDIIREPEQNNDLFRVPFSYSPKQYNAHMRTAWTTILGEQVPPFLDLDENENQ